MIVTNSDINQFSIKPKRSLYKIFPYVRKITDANIDDINGFIKHKKVAKIKKFLTSLNTSLKSNLSFFITRRAIKRKKVSVKAIYREILASKPKNNTLATYSAKNIPTRG